MANEFYHVPKRCDRPRCYAKQIKVTGDWKCNGDGCPYLSIEIPKVSSRLSFGWPPYPRNKMALLLDSTLQSVRDLNHQKGGEYAGDDDALANFRRNGMALGLEPEAIWGVYAAKHFDAIMQYIKDLSNGKTRPRSESIAGRADDLITYLVLFKALLQAREEKS